AIGNENLRVLNAGNMAIPFLSTKPLYHHSFAPDCASTDSGHRGPLVGLTVHIFLRTAAGNCWSLTRCKFAPICRRLPFPPPEGGTTNGLPRRAARGSSRGGLPG